MTKIKDPFGGVTSETLNVGYSPFKIDKEEALKELRKSYEIWKNIKKQKQPKSLLKKFLIKKDEPKEKAAHWEFSKNSRDKVNIHLFWSKSIIKTLFNVSTKQLVTALNNIRSFYKQISIVKPDLSNPYILSCYNQTAKNYKLPTKKITFKDQIEVKILNPFNGIKGEILEKVSNSLSTDKKKALDYIKLSINIFENLERNPQKKIIKKAKNFKLSYKTSNNYFDVYLIWANQKIKSIERISKPKARLALISLKDFIESLDILNPNLDDVTIKLMYSASKDRTKPGKKKKIRKEFLPLKEGGYSYWSHKKHKWITGKIDKKNGNFILPKKNL